MDVRNGPNENEFKEIVREVGVSLYGGNLREIGLQTVRSNLIRGRIAVHDNRGPGSRVSSSGRHNRDMACWHAWRDVLAELFARYPQATVTTGMARYAGRDGFMREYPLTSHLNVGSQIAPTSMLDLCNCYTAEEPGMPCDYGQRCIYGCQRPIRREVMSRPLAHESTERINQEFFPDDADNVTTFADLKELMNTYGNPTR